jgi:hypothetical protein
MATNVRCGVVLALACASWGQAHAVVSVNQFPNSFGDFSNIAYGNGGNLFELQPYLFVNGLGGASDAKSVVGLNRALSFSFSYGNVDPNMVTVQYRISNTSVDQSFDNLRFMVYANPDGDDMLYEDRVVESWGAAAPGEAARRQVVGSSGDIFASVVNTFKANNNLTDGGPSGACAAPSGCDATLGLQWNAPLLKPGETWQITVGLGDGFIGNALSNRWLSAVALNSPNTVLTLSGLASVTAVPEPGAWSMMVAGLLGLTSVARRRLAVANA